MDGLVQVREETSERSRRRRGISLTALLDALHGRIANGFVHGLDGVFDRGARVLLCVRAGGEAHTLAGSGGSQGGAGSFDRNGS